MTGRPQHSLPRALNEKGFSAGRTARPRRIFGHNHSEFPWSSCQILMVQPWSTYKLLIRSRTETKGLSDFFGGHSYRVVSFSYREQQIFHGGNTGSNPVGDVNKINAFHEIAV